MPSRDQHLAKADANRALLESVAVARSSPEWAITIAFYQAVHVVEAWAALRSQHHRSHRRRSETVNRELSPISEDYAELYEASRTARYAADGLLTWTDFDRLTAGLARIEAHVRAALR